MSTVERPEDVVGALGDLLADADRTALSGELAAFEVGNWAEIGRSEVWGWFDDDVATFAHWGFEPADVEGHVTLWHGNADRMVPKVNSEWLAAHLPDAELRTVPGQGHLSILDSEFGVALDLLLSRS